jgi:hypothetical protein
MSRFRAAPPILVMKTAEGERLKAALNAVLQVEDASTLLLGLVLDAEASAAARRCAFGALMRPAVLGAESAEAIFALAALWSNGVDPHVASAVADLGLNLYNEARGLPLQALMHRCGCATAPQLEAMHSANLCTVSDLVHYCSDVDSSGAGDLDESCSSLWMEMEGALSLPKLRALVHEARALCDVTAKLHGVTSESGNALGLAKEDLIVKEVADDDDDLEGIDCEEEGPVPGTRSVGC